jgi:hypothetical protein
MATKIWSSMDSTEIYIGQLPANYYLKVSAVAYAEGAILSLQS